jgi:hypothetical protein
MGGWGSRSIGSRSKDVDRATLNDPENRPKVDYLSDFGRNSSYTQLLILYIKFLRKLMINVKISIFPLEEQAG